MSPLFSSSQRRDTWGLGRYVSNNSTSMVSQLVCCFGRVVQLVCLRSTEANRHEFLSVDEFSASTIVSVIQPSSSSGLGQRCIVW